MRQLKNAQQDLENSWIIPYNESQARKELDGWSPQQFQDYLRSQMEKGEKSNNTMKLTFDMH